MALIKCPECGKEISSKDKICPNCGYKLKLIFKCKKYIPIVIICFMILICIIIRTSINNSNLTIFINQLNVR